MKKQHGTMCPLCEVECRGDGFLVSPNKGALITLSVKQCPACMRMVSMSNVRYLDAKQRAFLAKINGESEERCT